MDAFIRVAEATAYIDRLANARFALAVSVACGAAEVLLGADPALCTYYFRSGEGVPRYPLDSYALAVWTKELLHHGPTVVACMEGAEITVPSVPSPPWCVHASEATRFIDSLSVCHQKAVRLAWVWGTDALSKMADPPARLDLFLGVRLICPIVEQMDRWSIIAAGGVDPNWPEDMWNDHVAQWMKRRRPIPQ